MNRWSPVLVLWLLSVGRFALAATVGHEECERQLKSLSGGQVLTVPEVKDWGDAGEHYYAWNGGAQSKLVSTKSGLASASCVINRRTGEGFVTLRSKDLGQFKVKVPL
jgi:hypothetical protein